MNTFEKIFSRIENIEIIDSHEHLAPFESAREKPTDILREFIRQYTCSDIISSGMPRKDFESVQDMSVPLIQRWKTIEPFWNISRNTGYFRSIEISLKKLYGINRLTADNIEEADAFFQQSLNSNNQYNRVLKELSHIKTSVLDIDTGIDLECDRKYFSPVFHREDISNPTSISDIRKIEEQTGMHITRLDDLLEAFDILFDRAVRNGAAALKLVCAYWRSLYFPAVMTSEAERDFERIFRNLHQAWWNDQSIQVTENFESYMIHYMLRAANKRHMTVQIHTGIQEGNRNRICNSNPELLNDLFLRYPDIKFDLFHMSFPYQHTLGALAKNFPNVFINLCWANIISPTAVINILGEYLDSVPSNKIVGFGGDYIAIDAVYGHQYMARENISLALANKVEMGVMDIDWAVQIASRILFDNPSSLYGI